MDSNEEKNGKKHNNSGKPAMTGKKKAIIGVVAFLVVACCAAGYFLYSMYFDSYKVSDQELATLKASGTFQKGISVNGIDISGKTYDQAKAALEAAESDITSQISYTLKNNHGTVVITGEDFVVKINADEVLTQAIKYGKEGTSTERNAAQAEIKNGKNFELTMAIDKEATVAKIDTKVEPLSKAATEPSISISSNQTDLVYTDGSVGYAVDIEALNKLIIEQIDAGKLVATITVPTTEVQPTQSLSELKQNSTLIGQYKTTYTGTAERKYNVEKAAGLLNGTRVDPGQTISVNTVLGPRIAGRGWKLAHAISDGVFVDELGGGVCQVSSTLYNALLYSDVTIVNRSPHSIPSTYVPMGRDATISTGGPDLVFKNDDDHTIFIFAVIDKKSSTLTFKVYGAPLDDGMTISLTSKTIATLTPTATEKITVDTTKPVGYNEVVMSRSNGYKVQTYKNYVKNGSIVKTVLITTDTYPARAGSRIVGPTATETPAVTTTPTTSPSTTP